jgi:hypothetical protein
VTAALQGKAAIATDASARDFLCSPAAVVIALTDDEAEAVARRA